MQAHPACVLYEHTPSHKERPLLALSNQKANDGPHTCMCAVQAHPAYAVSRSKQVVLSHPTLASKAMLLPHGVLKMAGKQDPHPHRRRTVCHRFRSARHGRSGGYAPSHRGERKSMSDGAPGGGWRPVRHARGDGTLQQAVEEDAVQQALCR